MTNKKTWHNENIFSGEQDDLVLSVLSMERMMKTNRYLPHETAVVYPFDPPRLGFDHKSTTMVETKK